MWDAMVILGAHMGRVTLAYARHIHIAVVKDKAQGMGGSVLLMLQNGLGTRLGRRMVLERD